MASHPHTPPGAAGNTHHPDWRPPLSHEEVAALRCRPPHLRTDIPEVGAVVGYRDVPGGAVVAATVVSVQNMTGEPTDQLPDPLVWCTVVDPGTRLHLTGEWRARRYALVDDPWPSVVVRVDPHRDPKTGAVKGRRMLYETREARLPGEPGLYPATAIDWS